MKENHTEQKEPNNIQSEKSQKFQINPPEIQEEAMVCQKKIESLLSREDHPMGIRIAKKNGQYYYYVPAWDKYYWYQNEKMKEIFREENTYKTWEKSDTPYWSENLTISLGLQLQGEHLLEVLQVRDQIRELKENFKEESRNVAESAGFTEVEIWDLRGRGGLKRRGLPTVGKPYNTDRCGDGHSFVSSSLKVGQICGATGKVILYNYFSKGDGFTYSRHKCVAGKVPQAWQWPPSPKKILEEGKYHLPIDYIPEEFECLEGYNSYNFYRYSGGESHELISMKTAKETKFADIIAELKLKSIPHTEGTLYLYDEKPIAIWRRDNRFFLGDKETILNLGYRVESERW